MAAGFIAVLVGFTSSAVIVFQAATTAGASPQEISSWLFALGLSLAASCIGLSLYYRMPILAGWSTPGAALLVTSLSGVNMSEAIGAFIFAAILTILSGVTGVFEKIQTHIPRSLTAAMLAGILLHFGENVFVALQSELTLVSTMLLTYLLGKRFFPRYAIILVLVVGIAVASLEGLFQLETFQWQFAAPIFTMPVFSFSTLISIGIPLFIVTMTSQNMPGMAIINAAGFNPPMSPIISWIGTSTLLFAPFGCYSISLAAITAAICTGKEADNNPATRYRSTVFAGLCWLAIGVLGASVVTLFTAFPKALVLALAGLALISTVGNSLNVALSDESQREPAIITILVCASGFSLYGIGSAFWGLIAGVVSTYLLNAHKNKTIATVATLKSES